MKPGMQMMSTAPAGMRPTDVAGDEAKEAKGASCPSCGASLKIVAQEAAPAPDMEMGGSDMPASSPEDAFSERLKSRIGR